MDIDPTALRRWLQGGRKGRSTTDRAREFDVRRGADETTTVSRAAVERYLAAGVDPGPGHLRLPPAPRTRGVRPRRAWIGALAPVLSASLPRAEALDPHGASGAPQLSLSLG